ncbi:MAG: ATP-binding protein [Actinobacteria bacterium HGW-Actinobacteria-2]|nr:MAG: ATP-binding protein [Actinobacteria bacterium HGW-Actinobacteria-2]
MRREPTLTFEGALRTMRSHESKLVERLDGLLGGVILASGAAATIAALGPAGLAPLAVAIAPIWGWVDQKNEAIRILDRILRGCPKLVSGTHAMRRRDLVASAHTILTVAAFFEALQAAVGERSFASLELTNQEKTKLALGRSLADSEILSGVYLSEVPIPSPTLGFEENIKEVGVWLTALARRTQRFLEGLDAWDADRSIKDVVPAALDRYRERYMDMACDVPEFMIWSTLGEHSATRAASREGTASVMLALSEARTDLSRIEALLATTGSAHVQVGRQRVALGRANEARLDRPIISRDEANTLGDIEVPTVRNAFVSPAYKTARVESGAQIANEYWWRERPRQKDLDHWLAAYVISPDATRVPLLVLGHPGAGKSMLMKVLAARLPVEEYTCVLVPLRAVGANAPILDQVQQALDDATHKRVAWSELADGSEEGIRVLILDGLDELLQASRSDRSAFLQDVMEFQRVEAEQKRPVIAIVTSRTVVADRVDVPSRTAVLKIEEFDEAQVRLWLEAWNGANAAPIANGVVRRFTAGMALAQPELARQPLLLLMLAVYSGNPVAPTLDAGLSSASLYSLLIEEFARREATKTVTSRSAAALAEVAAENIERLQVAAISMFNRGRQSVREDELSADLSALLGDGSDGDLSAPGKRVLGQFFFMHTAEATVLGAGEGQSTGVPDMPLRTSRRSYEFLHATFGEYLIARMIIDELLDIVERAAAGRKQRDPEAGFLEAVLSHQTLASRHSILTFMQQICLSLRGGQLSSISGALSFLLANYRLRERSNEFAKYRPLGYDAIKCLAVFSSNLVVLRLLVEEHESVALVDLLSACEGGATGWRSMLDLWRSGLDADGYHAMISTIRMEDGVVSLALDAVVDVSPITVDYLHARLAGDSDAQARLRFGMAMNDFLLINDGSDPIRTFRTELYSDTLGISPREMLRDEMGAESAKDTLVGPRVVAADLPRDMSRESRAAVTAAIERLLLTRQPSGDLASQFIKVLRRLRSLDDVNPLILLVNACRFPSLLGRFLELRQVEAYDDLELAFLLVTLVPEAEVGDPAGRRAMAALRTLRSDLASIVPGFADDLAAAPESVRRAIVRLVLSLRDDRWNHGGESRLTLRMAEHPFARL